MIELKEDVFYYGYWFLGDGETYDWFCVAWRDGDTVRGKFRHRYYAGSDDPFDKSDRKSWYVFERPLTTDAEVCADLDALVRQIVQIGLSTGQFPADSDFKIESKHVCAMGDKMVEALSQASFAHAREVSEDESIELEGS